MAIGGEFTRRLLRDAGVDAGMRVLDVGCGTGDVALLAADLVGPGGQVLSIDRNGRMVEAARDRALAAGRLRPASPTQRSRPGTSMHRPSAPSMPSSAVVS